MAGNSIPAGNWMHYCRNMVKQQKYTVNLSGPPFFQIFPREDISGVSRQNRKIQMANHFTQAY
jgi:hypothetical protein